MRSPLVPFVVIVALGCEFPEPLPCAGSSECRSGRVCASGRCELEGSGPDRPVETSLVCGEHLPAADACLQCAAGECCDAVAACRANPGCAPVLDCFAGCDMERDGTCRARCLGQASPSSDPGLITSLWTCASERCSGECGGCGAWGLGTTTECLACVQDSAPACEAATECTEDPACGEPLGCILTCPDPKSCRSRCGGPVDYAATTARFLAAAGTCVGACAPTSNYACVGDFIWGGPTRDTVVTRVRSRWLVRAGRDVIEGAEVRMCELNDRACARPLATLVTDAAGWVEFETTASGSGDSVYFEVRAPGDALPQLAFFGPPRLIIDEQWSLGVVTAADLLLLAAQVGLTLDPGQAHVAVTALDCKLNFGVGVRVSMSPSGPDPVYVVDDIPRPDATGTGRNGVAFLAGLDVPDGAEAAQYLAEIADEDGRVLGAKPFFARPGWVSHVFVMPAERP